MIRALALVVMLFLAVPSPSAAQQAEDGSSANGQFKDFAELTAGTTAREGFFDTYEKAGALYMAIPVDRLDEEFLAAFEIAQGIGSSLLFGGLMLGIFGGDGIVALERHGDQVYLLRRPVRYVATSGSPEEAAVRLTYGSSVLASAKIESIRQDSALVIDIHDWIVSDLSDIGQMVRSAVSRQPGQPGSASFDGSRSYLESVKGFPDNVNFRAKLTFKTTRPANRRTVPDQRYLPVSMHTTFARLPEVPMTPRLADDRMGYFTTVQKNFSRDDTTFFVRYVNRWRLERGERVGDLYRPTEPIVYYLDRTIPDEYRPYVADGVERWNKAFEAAGWKDAIRAEPLPDDADPEDIRYATIRWNVSDEAGYGAIGPSTADPRTGEILDADILIEANMVLGFKSAWRNLASPADVFEGALTAGEADLASAAAGGELSTFGAQMAGQGALLRAVLAARGEIEPGASLPDEYVGQAMLWVTMHEVGHTLGLRHNFGSSRDTPLDELYDPAWAEENGVTGSVMDYHAPNLAPDGAMIDYYYSPVVGSYDDWIISYGYTADPTRAEELARQAGRRGHAYGTDFDAYGPGALDPTVNTFDLSADPLSWGKQRTSLIDAVWSELPGRVLGDNASYSDLTNAYTSGHQVHRRPVLLQHARRRRVRRRPVRVRPRGQAARRARLHHENRIRGRCVRGAERSVRAVRRSPLVRLGELDDLQRPHRLPVLRAGALYPDEDAGTAHEPVPDGQDTRLRAEVRDRQRGHHPGAVRELDGGGVERGVDGAGAKHRAVAPRPAARVPGPDDRDTPGPAGPHAR